MTATPSTEDPEHSTGLPVAVGPAPPAARGRRRWVRPLVVALTVLTVLLGLLFLGGGGNYFAGEIEAAALTVQPPTDEEDLTAVAVSRDSITLDVDDAGQWRDELGSDGVFGIQAGTAYGQVFGSTTGPPTDPPN